MTYPIVPDGQAFTPDGPVTLPETPPVLNCGHAPRPASGILPGYALVLGYTVCYDCMDEWERSFMASSGIFTGYIEYGPSGLPGSRFTTWTGGKLARITDITYSREMYGYHTGPWRHMYIRAVAPDGSCWYGHGSDTRNLITLHRCRNRAPE